MPRKPWQSLHAAKLQSAESAVAHIRNGQTIFVGSGGGEPTLLTRTMAERADDFWDVEVIHLAPVQDESPLARPELLHHFRMNTFYIGRGLSAAVAAGTADYTPMAVSELPKAMADGTIPIDVALIQVSPPDEFGLCSLGVAVDATKAAVESARLVIAQVNEYMPVTIGDSMVPVDAIHVLVEGSEPLLEVAPQELDPVTLTIGRHIASLVEDGMCLHFDRSPIASATMRYLDTKRDLGIHTEVLTDDILRLIRSGAVTNRKKQIDRGKTVATMVLGSRELYRAIEQNPYFDFQPIERVADSYVICQNDRAVAIQAVDWVELSGLARVGESGTLSSLPTSLDFINGSNRSRGGFSIMALPSTSFDGTLSRIVTQSVGAGVSFNRSKVEYVVTEYGVVNLYGLSIRERAIALISIAHPRFREALLEEAKALHYVPAEQTVPPEHGSVYPHRYEFRHTFRDGTEVLFRPVRPADARRLQRMFYRLTPESIRMRYHGSIKSMPLEMAQRLATIDYSRDMAIIGLVGPRHNPRAVAEGRLVYNPTNNMGEFDIIVDEEYRGRGLGIFLANHLNKIAYSRGLSGVYAEVISQNAATMALLSRAWPTAQKTFSSDSVTFTVRFPPEDVERPKDSIMVYSGRFGDFSYGQEHPFNPGRARATLHLLQRLGYLKEPWMRIEEPKLIQKEQLFESHRPDYIEALARANDGHWREEFLQFGLGGDDCPVFPGLFDYVLLYTAATLTGVDLILDQNANVVMNCLGGFHHANRAHAEGFCYVNDAVAAIDRFLARGFRVAYVDLDAHHGNGVQDAYYRDDRVLFVSLHQSGKTLYPWTGFEGEIGENIGRGYTLNVPLPEGTDDEAYEWVFDRLVLPALDRFMPQVIVAVVGADTHKADPLTDLNMTNNSLVHAVHALREVCQHLLLLGGGGYDLQAVTRAWARVWASANRIDALPDYMLVMGGQFMGGAGLEGAEIVDMPFRVSGEQKEAIMAELERIAQFHEQNTLPLIGATNRGR